MLFNSWGFLLGFLPVALLAYWMLRSFGQSRLALLSLTLASYVFYAIGEKNYPWLLALSIAANFSAGLLIQRHADPWARRWLIAGVTFDLLLLGYFKYLNFAIANLQDAGVLGPVDWRVILPVGISFYTFTQIAFLVDAYRGKVARNNPLHYGLFVTFFPHLIAGPILHHAEMMPQFDRDVGRLSRNLLTGGVLFAIGLFKKVVIADQVAPIASQVFGLAAKGQELSFAAAWLGVLAYTVQIYFDFSGYSDMAIGLGRMFGIDLPINFNSPYKSRSITEFWRRWHITLSRFLRDYLYIPLGGNRKGPIRRHLNLFLTMVLGGIWHGAGWTFLIWGALHGSYLMVHHGWTAVRSRYGWGTLPSSVAWILTLLAAMFAWVPFRAPSLHASIAIWQTMLGMQGFSLPDLYMPLTLALRDMGCSVDALRLDRFQQSVIVIGLGAALWLPNSQQVMARAQVGLDSPGYDAKPPMPAGIELGLRPWLWPWRPSLRWTVLVAAMFGLSLRWMTRYSEFIYFQF